MRSTWKYIIRYPAHPGPRRPGQLCQSEHIPEHHAVRFPPADASRQNRNCPRNACRLHHRSRSGYTRQRHTGTYRCGPYRSRPVEKDHTGAHCSERLQGRQKYGGGSRTGKICNLLSTDVPDIPFSLCIPRQRGIQAFLEMHSQTVYIIGGKYSTYDAAVLCQQGQ